MAMSNPKNDLFGVFMDSAHYRTLLFPLFHILLVDTDTIYLNHTLCSDRANGFEGVEQIHRNIIYFNIT